MVQLNPIDFFTLKEKMHSEEGMSAKYVGIISIVKKSASISVLAFFLQAHIPVSHSFKLQV